MPTKKDRVGTEGGKKSKSAYKKRQSRHGRRKEEQECLRKKTGWARREERRVKVPIKEKRIGTHRDNKGKSACHKERNKYAIHKKGESMRYNSVDSFISYR